MTEVTGGAMLIRRYDQVIFDLDGVLYLGDQPVAGAAAAVGKLRGLPVDIVYATNNASRSPQAVADLLTSIGIPAAADEVLTSSRAAAAVLAERFPAGSKVLVVGAPALVDEVRRRGLRPVESAADGPVAVVQGYGPAVGWRELAEACVAIRGGAAWVATNGDRTLPSPRGPLPGNGALVAALATALDRGPDVTVGKPAAGLFSEAIAAGTASRPLVVGDRLDTDIEGANRAGMDSLLVLTGVCRPLDLLRARPDHRPTYVALDLEGLFDEPVTLAGGDHAGWRVDADATTLVLDGEGAPAAALAALCATWWRIERTSGDGPGVTGATERARAVLTQLGLGEPA